MLHNGNILFFFFFFDKDSANVTFSSDEVGILSVDFNNINLDDANFYEDDPKTIIM